jgi:hypothetical protein
MNRVVPFLLALTLGGCSVAPEQPLLEQFFAASRLRDKTVLQAFSTVTFEPLEQGIVRSFVITRISPEEPAGGTVSKEVTVTAPVELQDGRTVQKTLIVTMQRIASAGAPKDSARWVITGVAAFQPSPRS